MCGHFQFLPGFQADQGQVNSGPPVMYRTGAGTGHKSGIGIHLIEIQGAGIRSVGIQYFESQAELPERILGCCQRLGHRTTEKGFGQGLDSYACKIIFCGISYMQVNAGDDLFQVD